VIDIRAISLGAGVQSTALYLMAVAGEFDVMPDVAIFADTQAEPAYVYEHLDELERAHGAVIPIRRISAGSLEADALRSGGFVSLPLFVRGDDGRENIVRRQCTREYKIEPIKNELR
jgi:3'-phosphoadenosine 5'-phosphosulfate sulfotransferase (PAPS reductase)/FAD synthetase